MDDQLRTGVAQVDGVIEMVASLEDRALAEHPGVFTAAQERLRRALDTDPDAAVPPEQG